MVGHVALVGAGPGDPGLLTIRGRELLGRADVVIYDALISDSLLSLAPAAARRVYVGKRAGRHARPQAEINELLVREARAGRFVVRLKGGDPFLFGRGGEEALHLAEHEIPFEVVPGVSALAAVPAAAGIPVTDRSLSSCLIATTGHEDPSKGGPGVDWSHIATVPGTLILFMGVRNLGRIVEALLAAGRPASTPAAVIHSGTLPNQQTVLGTLADIGERVETAQIGSPALVVIGEVVELRDRLNWFEGRPLFGRTVVVTRPREQAREMCSKLAELGACIINLPMIRIGPPADPGPLHTAVKNLEHYDWVIFTSTNAVKSFFSALTGEGGDARRLGTCRIAAIGPATAEALQRQGIVADLVPDRFNSEGLAEALCTDEKVAGRRVLYPCSSLAQGEITDRLRGTGATVERVEAYSVIPEETPAGLWDEPPDVITFASPSAVTNFVDRIRPEELDRLKRKSAFAALGPATSARMTKLGLSVHIQAEEQTAAGLISAIVEYYKQDHGQDV